MVDFKKIRVSGYGRKAATEQFDESMEFVQEAAQEHGEHSDDYERGYFTTLFEKLRDIVTAKAWVESQLPPGAAVLTPMTEAESDRHGRQLIEYGKYPDVKWQDVPPDYLRWLLERSETVIRFAKSKQGQQILGELDAEEES